MRRFRSAFMVTLFIAGATAFRGRTALLDDRFPHPPFGPIVKLLLLDMRCSATVTWYWHRRRLRPAPLAVASAVNSLEMDKCYSQEEVGMTQQTLSNIAESLPAAPTVHRGPVNQALVDLLDQWIAEDATDDPEVILQAEKELTEFKQAMNQNRVLAGESPLYP